MLRKAVLLALALCAAGPALAQPVWPPPWRPHPHWRRPWSRPVYGGPAIYPYPAYAPGYYVAPLYPIPPQPYMGADGVGQHPH